MSITSMATGITASSKISHASHDQIIIDCTAPSLSFKRKMRTWLKRNKRKIGGGKDGRFVSRARRQKDYKSAR
jgi:hypothetical protein